MTTSSVQGSSTSLGESERDSSALDAVLSDRSLLTLGLAGLGPSGRFRVEPGNSPFLMPLEGRFWVTEKGNVYTAVDVDNDLIAEQMRGLVEALERVGGQGDSSPYLASLEDHYRGSEFQLGLVGVVRWAGVGPLPAEWIEQWTWFSEVDRQAYSPSETLPPELFECEEAIQAYDSSALAWAGELDPEFFSVEGAERWVFPVSEMEEALSSELEGTLACQQLFEGPPGDAEVHFDLRAEAGSTVIDVFVDPKIYVDREAERLFSVRMWSAGDVGAPPEQPSPADLLTLRGTYLAAVGICGELPWIYSNFAAANTYYSPVEGGYFGPTLFSSDWLCAEQVPDQ